MKTAFKPKLKKLILLFPVGYFVSTTLSGQSLHLGGGGSSAFDNGQAPAVTTPPAIDPMSGVPSSPKAAQDPVAPGLDVSDLLRIGDTVIIRLTGVPTADQGIFEVKIDESGKISMPYIGSVSAANATTVQLKKMIESTYIKEEIFTNPNVTVDLKEQRFVDVTGEVRMPQRVPYTKDLTAMGAVAACGGFTDFANRRKVKLTQGGVTREFNAKEIQADQGRDIKLTPNDKIQVDRSIF